MLRSFAVGYERFCRVVLMIAVTHVAFLIHTLMGVVVIGLFPSISATYTTYRTWWLDEDHSWSIRQTWTVFHRAWKDELAGANRFGWPQALLWLLLIFDYWVVNFHDAGTLGYASAGVLLIGMVFYGLFCSLSWAIRANFNESGWWIVRMTLQMVIARPLCSLCLTVLVILTVCAWMTWPGLVPAFGVALPVFFVMMIVGKFGKVPGMARPTEDDKPRLRLQTTGTADK